MKRLHRAERGEQGAAEFAIAVGVRIRPLIASELLSPQGSPNGSTDDAQYRQASMAWQEVGSDTIVELSDKRGLVTGGQRWDFSRVFPPSASTQDVYDDICAPIVQSTLEGFNGTVFAYGQTSSGKTHTLMGTAEEPGIIVLAVHDVFEQIQGESAESEFLIRISYFEIYNEVIEDLFVQGHGGGSASRAETPSKKVRIADASGSKGPQVVGAVEHVVTDPEQVLSLLAQGELSRHYGSTGMNERSSRSHTIFRMVVEKRRGRAQASSAASPKASVGGVGGGAGGGTVWQSTLNLVDLAGSERLSKTRTSGQRLREGQSINLSLLTLGRVLKFLAKQQKARAASASKGGGRSAAAAAAKAPFRDSQLTRLLQTSLGGNARTAMISTISPAHRNRAESKMTLLFSGHAKAIVNRATRNRIAAEDSELLKYREQIKGLQERIAAMEYERAGERAGAALHEGAGRPPEEKKAMLKSQGQVAAATAAAMAAERRKEREKAERAATEREARDKQAAEEALRARSEMEKLKSLILFGTQLQQDSGLAADSVQEIQGGIEAVMSGRRRHGSVLHDFQHIAACAADRRVAGRRTANALLPDWTEEEARSTLKRHARDRSDMSNFSIDSDGGASGRTDDEVDVAADAGQQSDIGAGPGSASGTHRKISVGSYQMLQQIARLREGPVHDTPASASSAESDDARASPETIATGSVADEGTGLATPEPTEVTGSSGLHEPEFAEGAAELRRLRCRVADLEAELAEEHEALCSETRRADEAEACVADTLDRAARKEAEAHARARAAEVAADVRCKEAAKAEARATAREAEAEVVIESSSARELIGEEEREGLNSLAQQLALAEAAREDAEAMAEAAELGRREAEVRLQQVEAELGRARKTAKAVQLAASAATKTSRDDNREAAGQHERLAKLASSQRSLLVQLRHVLGRYTDDLRSPALGLAAASDHSSA